MSPIPIGAFLGAVRGAAKPAPATDDGPEGADFGMALGLAITNRSPAATSDSPAQGTAASPAATTAGGPCDPAAASAAPQSASAANGAVDASSPVARGATLRALALELGQALGADLANGAPVPGEPGAIALDPALAVADDGTPAGTPTAPLRAIASALPIPASPDVGAALSIAPAAGAVTEPQLARAGARVAIGTAAAMAASTEPVASVRTAGIDASPAVAAALAAADVALGVHEDPSANATTAAPAIQAGAAGADHRGRARRETTESAPSPAFAATDDAAPIAAPPPSVTAEAVRAAADASTSPQAATTIPRDLANALDAASLAPRRALDQVTLPFEGENGLEGRLRIALRGNALHATIVTPDAASAARIEGAMGELHRALVERGFGDVRLAIQHTSAAADAERARSDTRDDARDSSAQRKARDEERAASHQQHRRRRDERGQEG